MRHRRIVLLIICLALALLPVTHDRVARADEPAHVTLRLDWLPTGYHAPLFLGVARGIYTAHGIDLQINDGKGSAATIQAVAGGSDTIGLASLSTMALAVSKGVPLVAVAGMIQKMPDAVISLKGSGIETPKDLEGKRYAFVPDDAGARLFPAFAGGAGIDFDKIQKVQVGYATIYSTLLQGNADFITGWAFTDALKIAKQKPIGTLIGFADHGVNMFSTGFIVTPDTLEHRAPLLKAFLAATAESFAAADKDPVAAVDAMMAARPTSDRDLMLEEFKLTPPYLHTANSAGHPFGWMAPADWDQTRALLQKYFGMNDTGPTTQFYTDDLIAAQ
jgi:NitT/TauT family transport system substrate-binding protein